MAISLTSSRESLVANLVGRIRHERRKGRDYLVVPLSLIVPGVLNGSQGPLFYPLDEIQHEPQKWHNIPLTVWHPTDPLTNSPLSASDPGVLDRQGVGFVRQPFARNRLQAEGWIDVAKMRKIDNKLSPQVRVLPRLERGIPVELSTGLFTDNIPKPGNWNGRPYTHEARNYRPDHVAILPDQVGACSIQDGCGVLVNKDSKNGCGDGG